jgi:DNA-3-methyladenine glycosylase II
LGNHRAQINLAFAYTLKRRLVENFGRRVDCEGKHYWLFPTPQDIASLTAQDLAGLQMSVKKCEYLIGVAHLIVDGKLTLEEIKRLASNWTNWESYATFYLWRFLY